MLKKTVRTAVIVLMAGLCPADAYKTGSGEGLWYSENSNTHGKGNLWLTGFGRGFNWDNPTPETGGGFPFKVFPCAGADYGLLSFMDAGVSSELLSYGFQVPGNLKLRTKLTLPNNAKLRLFGAAFSAAYTYNFLEEYASIAGYRNPYVGFYAEGVMYGKSSLEMRLIGDLDFIRWKSYLPLKAYLNLGYKMQLARSYSFYDQYVFSTGVEYKSLATDFFLEFHMEILNGFSDEITVHLVDGNGFPKIFPHYFRENPMYLTPGVRVRYENGLTLLAGVSIMRLGAFQLTRERGYEDGLFSPERVAALRAKGVDWIMGFSPFYADWKLVGRVSYPLFYTMPTSETIRKFLLMKNKPDRQVIDIDEMLGAPKKSGEKKKAEAKKTDEKPAEGKKDK